MKKNKSLFFPQLKDKESVMQIALDCHLTYHAVRLWPNRCIPEKHWGTLISKHNATNEELRAHNDLIRSK